ncbi:DUF4129 domain-containing transglutaminase family protein [Listeria goaensis]|uniref:DUF4129 domain-containing transglutaminase family protein n=1 Tax=Listeria goaensis TaxID=1649188 RepID=UPI000B58D9DE|nr:transglutaminase domain-containing protein [Listeria goaensis]
MRAKLLTIILYILSILLISEWVYPFIFLTNLTNPLYMIIYVALSLGMFFLGWRFYATLPLHLLLIYFLMGIYFNDGHPFELGFLSTFVQIIQSGFRDLFAFNAYDISMAFITLIFFVAIWLLNYITSFTLLKKQRIMSVLALTVAYIAVVNTFTEYAGQMALVRTVIIGFLLLHFALSKRLETPNRLSGLTDKKRPIFYHVALIALLGVFLGSALLFPQQKPVFNDPVPYIRESLGMNTTRTVGYSEDDSELGGALKPDHSQVFQVWAEKEHYYRVETKRAYTGRGWATSNRTDVENFKDAEAFPLALADKYQSKESTLDVQFDNANDYLVYTYGTHSFFNSKEVTFALSDSTEKVTPAAKIRSYSMSVAEPVYDVKLMKAAKFNELSDQFLAAYTQLPTELPKRVGNLAEKVTKNADTTYDQVKAIENYLSFTGGFRYSTEDAKTTPQDADYVDQFLFETKVGYCDNFSTSMVVMLRTIGIPARFSKGFTSGDEIRSENNKTLYSVKNNNAHSWPEVYFPGTGWVPFEPTATFQNPEEFIDSTEERQVTSDAPSSSEDTQKGAQEETTEQRKNAEQGTDTGQTQTKKDTTSTEKTAINPRLIFWSIFGTTVLIALMIFIFRKQIQLFWFKRAIQKEKWTFETSYLKLLHLLKNYGYIREPSETLSAFAARTKLDGFQELTTTYENWLYGNQNTPVAKKDFERVIHVIQSKKRGHS